jgi:hypothetical protein
MQTIGAKQHIVNDQRVIDEIKEEFKRFLKLMKMKTQHTRTCGAQ